MTILFSFPQYEHLADKIAKNCGFESGEAVIREFPDGESYVRIISEVKGQNLVVVCGFDNPDAKIMKLIFFAKLAKELGAKQIGLITPYLGYMRQDKRFNSGEAVTSNIFAALLSQYADWLITIDPHLHRHKSLDEIYNIPTHVCHAAGAISGWIKDNIENPLLIGPDEESDQWLSAIALKSKARFITLKKVRYGDKEVKITLPNIDGCKNYHAVLIDDIVSSAATMIEAARLLKPMEFASLNCIAVHPVFADDAYKKLQESGVARVISCNTIKHHSNAIDISALFSKDIINGLQDKIS